MSSAKFTLWGCEKYFNTLNQSVFDNLRVPEGLTKETLTDNILLRGGEFEVQYGNPDFVRLAIGAWSNKWMPTMERWVRALAIEYNPLENYDRMEDWTDNTTRSDAVSSSDTSDRIQGRKEDISHADAEGYTVCSSFRRISPGIRCLCLPDDCRCNPCCPRFSPYRTPRLVQTENRDTCNF